MKIPHLPFPSPILAFLLATGPLAAQDDPWQPVGEKLRTPWAGEVNPDRALPDYPRPQLVRQAWGNLNGIWEYAITPKDAEPPEKFDGKILVPFPIESSLSGVGKTVGPDQRLYYRTRFALPQAWREHTLLLHFGAVDWETTVWVNGKKTGEHRGGYDPFTIDVTAAISEAAEQDLLVSVWDPTDAGYQPRGKQVREPEGIWYTSVTGIWQTVWLEPVPKASIASLKLLPDIDQQLLRITAQGRGASDSYQVRAEALEGGAVIGEAIGRAGREFTLRIPEPKLWSPDSPFLYGLRVSLHDGTQQIDSITSYFGMRKIAVARDDRGVNRLFLNNQPLFQFGPLDQGWWPDGLYTAPTDDALAFDIEATKELGFNMARKHVKVEPDRWYFHCDRLGLLVWQDLPNGDRHIRPDEPDIQRSPESAENYRRELQAMIDFLHNHPSIVAWVPFNEGWGQFDTNAILAWTKEYDPSRLVDGPSGWSDRGEGDMVDIHSYPGPAMPALEENRAAVLGEFGGLGWPVPDHLWWDKRNWGYRTYTSQEELISQYQSLIQQLLPLIGQGLAAAIYTQTTDVEGEVNGLLTYDRTIRKLPAESVRDLNLKVYDPPRVYRRDLIAADSQNEGQSWRYTIENPGEGWAAADFDASSWKEGPGGFGTRETPGAVVRTEWNSDNIWIRRTFDLGEDKDMPANPHFRIHHDEDVEVFLNGASVLKREGYVSNYLEIPFTPAAKAALAKGPNTLAVHCRQTRGGQYIDLGIIDLVEEKPE